MKRLLFCLLSYSCGMPFFASGQPIRTALLAPPAPVSSPGQPHAASYSLRITNDSLLKNYTNITLRWQFLVNGLVRQQGSSPGLTLLPGHPRMLHLPLKPPAPGEESYIKVEYRNPSRNIAAQTLPMTPWGGDIRIPATGELSFADSNNIFTVSSPTLQLSFDKESGWLLQYTVMGQTLLADSNGLRPALPAPPHLQLFSTSTGSQMVIVRTEYTVPELSCLLHLSYTVNSNGTLLVESTLETDTTHQDSVLHPIDRFGMDWTLPPGADSLIWFGLPGATTPGAPATPPAADTIPSIHKEKLPAVETLPVAEKLPAAAIAKNVRWCDIHDSAGKGFHLTTDCNLLQLHISSLRTILNIDSDLPPHPALPIHFQYRFKVTPLITPLPHRAAKPI